VPCTGGFISIGRIPTTAFLGTQLELDKRGYISLRKSSDADECTTMSSVEGVFACGDVADSRYQQAVTAAGTGAQAAIDVHQWLGKGGKGGAVLLSR
jgi:thioredoxin reductase (NADPH)